MSGESYVIKARGLPWSATAAEVIEFFSGISILVLILYIFLLSVYFLQIPQYNNKFLRHVSIQFLKKGFYIYRHYISHYYNY